MLLGEAERPTQEEEGEAVNVASSRFTGKRSDLKAVNIELGQNMLLQDMLSNLKIGC